MAVYTVHEPPLKRYETDADPERFVFVREGFSFWAFLFGPLWMLRHRMWVEFIAYLLLVGGLTFALRRLGFVVTRDGEVKALSGPSADRIKRVAGTLVGP